MKNAVTQFANRFLQGTNRERAANALLIGALVLGVSIAALNGGNAPKAMAGIDSLKTWLTDFLTSTWTVTLAIIALLGAVWAGTHGKGWGSLTTIIVILAVAFLGPDMIVTIATKVGAPVEYLAPLY